MITFANILVFLLLCGLMNLQDRGAIVIGFLLIILSLQIRMAIEKSKK
jgi:hypothetical protein